MASSSRASRRAVLVSDNAKSRNPESDTIDDAPDQRVPYQHCLDVLHRGANSRGRVSYRMETALRCFRWHMGALDDLSSVWLVVEASQT